MRIRALLALPGLLLAAASLGAQEPEKVDSLEQRLEQAERMIEMLQVQVAEQAEGGVQTSSGIGLELSGMLLFNGFYTDGIVNNPDVPMIVLPPSTDGFPDQTLSATVRQTRLILAASLPDVLGGEASGLLDVDFYGGHQALGRTVPLPRIRVVRADLRWSNAWLMFGQDALIVSDINPSSLAAIGVPGFSMSGNLWFWMPQMRVGADLPVGPARVGLEGSVVAPTNGAAGYFPPPSQTERSGRPYFQGRLLATWGDPDLSGGTASIGGHYGWFATDGDSLLVSKAATATAQFFVTQYVEIRAEGFIGEGVEILGGGGVGQNFGADGSPLKSKGGWGQVNILPTPQWEIGGGAGIDDPEDGELPTDAGRLKNFVWEAHLIWRPSPLVFGFEFRRLETTYGDPSIGKQTANHYNVAAGFEF
jgi:hypothetical protein